LLYIYPNVLWNANKKISMVTQFNRHPSGSKRRVVCDLTYWGLFLLS
jgi:hypothetical protein